MKVKPVITIENSGKGTRVKLLDIDISTALRNVSYSTSGKTSGNNTVVLEININGLIDVLTEITPEDMRNAQEILAPYKESRAHLKEIIS